MTTSLTVVRPPSCWNVIGVNGDGSCPELVTHVHCRNCPVYSTAGLQLLNRQLTPEYRRERTLHFARQKTVSVPGKMSAVIFRINNEWLALPTQAFQEIAERRLVHSLPHRRKGIVLGLVNIRGELLICVAVGRLLGLEPVGPRELARKTHDRLLVVSWEANRLTFPVEEVHGIHRFQPAELKAPPATVAADLRVVSHDEELVGSEPHHVIRRGRERLGHESSVAAYFVDAFCELLRDCGRY